MRTPYTISAVVVLIHLASFFSEAGESVDTAPRMETPPPSEASEPNDDAKWAVTASVFTYIHAGENLNYAQPTVTADRGRLHLEARYNYEALETASTWLGCNFSGGEKFEWTVTPMLGAVFGEETGVAPGVEISLSWWKLELYFEGEYVAVPGDSEANFFYGWSEISISPWDWCRLGIVAQRTRAYQTDRTIERGILVGFTYKHLDFTTYVLNLDESKPTTVVALSWNF